MNNHIVDIRSQGRESFDHALAIFMGKQVGGHQHATHFSIVEPGTKNPDQLNQTRILDEKAPTFVLFWFKPEWWDFGEVNVLPYKMDPKQVGDLVWGWLQERPREEYGEYIDHDGSLGKGFWMWNENWTRVGGSPYGICAVRPIFAWYGK